jgi:hypothetical protein
MSICSLLKGLKDNNEKLEIYQYVEKDSSSVRA